jgi:hypothetical protein
MTEQPDIDRGLAAAADFGLTGRGVPIGVVVWPGGEAAARALAARSVEIRCRIAAQDAGSSADAVARCVEEGCLVVLIAATIEALRREPDLAARMEPSARQAVLLVSAGAASADPHAHVLFLDDAGDERLPAEASSLLAAAAIVIELLERSWPDLPRERRASIARRALAAAKRSLPLPQRWESLDVLSALDFASLFARSSPPKAGRAADAAARSMSGAPRRRGRPALVECAARYRPADDLWIVTAYYNPSRYASRIRNAELFCAKLQNAGLNWLAIECASGDAPFDLPPSPRVVHVRSRDLLWQKERLLNLAIAALPASCRKIAWLDADVLFEDPDWAVATSALLETHAVVQPFDRVIRLPRGHHAYLGDGVTWEGFADVFARFPNAVAEGDFAIHGHSGFAWAARRDVVEAHGLYDACVAGGGDHLIAHAFSGEWDSRCIQTIFGDNAVHAAHGIAWCERVYPHVRARIGRIPGALLHLWHGDVPERRYRERVAWLAGAGFDPDRDIRIGAEGCWEWSSDKPALHAKMRDYFSMRREDG